MGNPNLKTEKGGFYFAYDLLSRNCQNQSNSVFFEFKKKYISEINKLLITLFDKSPVPKIIFTTDYQFSDNKPKRVKNLSLRQFWNFHKTQELLFNTLYEINKMD